MKRLIITMAAACILSLPHAVATEYPVIPAPAEYTAYDAFYKAPPTLAIKAGKGVDKTLLQKISDYLDMRGIDNKDAKKADVTFVKNDKLGQESYVLDIDSKGITIEANTDQGFFYAIQTIAQMLDVSADRNLRACHIVDYPRMEYRGMMLDPSRWFIPKEEVMKMIDVASSLKINNLHLHLSDDNGWRIEIKKYPRLTEVGAWRVDREEYFPGRLNPQPGEPTPIGGFYTQDDMREIVDYAAARHINVIPEIDVPAHSAAAIASYPELACPVTDKFVGVFPGIGGPDASIILCAGNENVYKFYEDIIDEIVDIFPSKYIHLGGDEAEKSHWQKCPLCNAKKEAEHLADWEELQGYFMDRLNRYVYSKGRTPMGWDEVTHGKPKEEMVILGWNGYGQAAVDYAKKTGSKFILTPARVLYFIRYQGPQWFEPFTYFGNSTLKNVFEFEPVKNYWSEDLRNQFMGLQGSLWSEFIVDENHLEYQMFPRLIALADLTWRPREAKDWESFLTALDAYLPTMDQRGVTYARSMFNLDHVAKPSDDGSLLVDLSCIRPDVEIRVSDSDPSLMAYNKYTGPISVSSPGKIYASTFRDGKQEGKTLTLDLNFNKATGRTVESPNCNNELTYVLTNGLNGSDRNSDFEWAGWHNRTAEFTVDLGKVMPVESASVSSLSNSHLCIASPSTMELYGSTDGENFVLLGTVSTPEDSIYAKGAKINNLLFDNLENCETRYLKFVANNPGPVPDGYARATAPTWLYFDEITVK